MSSMSKTAQPSGSSTSASSSAATTAAAAAAQPSNVQEFNIRVPKNLRKKHHVMRFNATLNVDFAQWRMVKLERENNMKEFKGFDEDMPKFGAGSEYNRDLREEVRRKKFGIIAKKYRPDAQPWILKVGGKSGKKFKGIREGGVSENAAFYVFTHAPDGAIEAYPLNEWYNFQPIQRYKSLSAEEAEHEFGRRKKVMNYFSLMLRKRLKGDEEDPEQDPEEVKVKGGSKKAKELKISDMDEWIDSEDESDSEEEGEKEKKEEDSDDDAKKKKNKKGQPEKKKKKDVDDEAFEESDDGDEEGREMDYDTESSEDEPDPESKLDKDMKSVAEEDALRKLLTSDEEDEEEKKSDESGKDEEKKKQKDKEDSPKEKKKTKKQNKDEKKDSSSDFSSDSSDSENEDKKKKPNPKESSKNPSRAGTPTGMSTDINKRKGNSMPSDLTGSENSNSPLSTPAKRMKVESAPALPSTFAGVVNSSNSKDDYGITEDAVRRYLVRKPMTATELLTKFKNKKTGVSSERLVETMTQILKKINPVKQTIQGKMYLSIKTK
ncbi:general transcription factor IIF subunit 1 [Episyrphus balteatus]|uniref:general transcription factor IIF subunit 1 n=1 Tax=Episyrphus balteatus TaxID=286459 RepID=UPI0024851BB2|nr:general transcription factor IIF subunit 1 [Episyrphus balteatus]